MRMSLTLSSSLHSLEAREREYSIYRYRELVLIDVAALVLSQVSCLNSLPGPLSIFLTARLHSHQPYLTIMLMFLALGSPLSRL